MTFLGVNAVLLFDNPLFPLRLSHDRPKLRELGVNDLMGSGGILIKFRFFTACLLFLLFNYRSLVSGLFLIVHI